jgi:hypothetical protein
MKNSDWKDIAELFGIAAIVASLIFVGLQMKQSQEIAIAEQFHNRAIAVMSLYESHMETGYVARVPGWRERVENGDVAAADINSFLWLWISFDNHFFQYQSGFMEESAWQAQLRNIRGVFNTCPMRFVYEWRKDGLRSEFVTLVESLDDPCAATE